MAHAWMLHKVPALYTLPTHIQPCGQLNTKRPAAATVQYQLDISEVKTFIMFGLFPRNKLHYFREYIL